MERSLLYAKIQSLLFLSIISAVEWYEEGEGGYTLINAAGIAPANFGSFQNTGSATSMIVDDGSLIGDEGDFLGAFYDGELRGIAVAEVNDLPPSPHFGESIYYL